MLADLDLLRGKRGAVEDEVGKDKMMKMMICIQPLLKVRTIATLRVRGSNILS